VTNDTPTPKKTPLLRRALNWARVLLSLLVYAATFLVYVAVLAVVGGAVLWLAARGQLTFGECKAIVALLVLAVTLIAHTSKYVTFASDVASFLSHLVQYGVKPVNDYEPERRRRREQFERGLSSIDAYRPLTVNPHRRSAPLQSVASEIIRAAAMEDERISGRPSKIGVEEGVVILDRIDTERVQARNVIATTTRDGEDVSVSIKASGGVTISEPQTVTTS